MAPQVQQSGNRLDVPLARLSSYGERLDRTENDGLTIRRYGYTGPQTDAPALAGYANAISLLSDDTFSSYPVAKYAYDDSRQFIHPVSISSALDICVEHYNNVIRKLFGKFTGPD